MIKRIADGVQGFDTQLRVGPGFTLPARSTILEIAPRKLAVIAPLAFDAAAAEAIEERGDVVHLVAPNLLHTGFLGAAAARWPAARRHGAPGLAARRPELDLQEELGASAALGADIELVAVAGAPSLSEVAILHRPSRTLVLTDLVFHVLAPRGLLTGLILRIVGAHRCLAQSRAVRFMARDRAALAASAERLLALDFDRLVMAHGEVIERGAKAQLEPALRWMLSGAQRQLPARSAAELR